MSATTARPLSSGEFCKVRHDTIPVKSASALILLSIPITLKCQILSCGTLVGYERHVVQNNCIYWRKKNAQKLKYTWTDTVGYPPYKLDVSSTPALCKSLSLKICVFQVMGGLRRELNCLPSNNLTSLKRS